MDSETKIYNTPKITDASGVINSSLTSSTVNNSTANNFEKNSLKLDGSEGKSNTTTR